MDYEELKEVLERVLKDGTHDRLARALCEIETAAGIRSIIQALYQNMPKEEIV